MEESGQAEAQRELEPAFNMRESALDFVVQTAMGMKKGTETSDPMKPEDFQGSTEGERIARFINYVKETASFRLIDATLKKLGTDGLEDEVRTNRRGGEEDRQATLLDLIQNIDGRPQVLEVCQSIWCCIEKADSALDAFADFMPKKAMGCIERLRFLRESADKLVRLGKIDLLENLRACIGRTFDRASSADSLLPAEFLKLDGIGGPCVIAYLDLAMNHLELNEAAKGAFGEAFNDNTWSSTNRRLRIIHWDRFIQRETGGRLRREFQESILCLRR
jgi:hypothetical protein